MARPKPDRGYVDEAKVAFRGLVVSCCNAAGVLELVEASLDQIAQSVECVIHPHAQLAGFAHRYLGEDVTFTHGFPNAISVIAAICQQHAWFWQIVIHDQIKAQIIRGLPWRDVGSHGQAVRVDAEMDLGREATS